MSRDQKTPKLADLKSKANEVRKKPLNPSTMPDETTVNWANEFGLYLSGGRDKMTTSQLRNFFNELKRTQAVGFSQPKIQMLRVQLAYVKGRHKGKIEAFVDVIEPFLRESIIKGKDEFYVFVQIVEAIVAFRKAEGNDE